MHLSKVCLNSTADAADGASLRDRDRELHSSCGLDLAAGGGRAFNS